MQTHMPPLSSKHWLYFLPIITLLENENDDPIICYSIFFISICVEFGEERIRSNMDIVLL